MTSFSKSTRQYFNRTIAWLSKENGAKARMFLFGSTVVAYPIGLTLWNGPLIKYTFRWLHSPDYQLPEHVKRTVDEQYERWLASENRLPKDAVVKFSCQNDAKHLDSISAGSMGVRFGAQIAFPFFVRFRTKEEALEYCKRHLEPFLFRNKIPLCIVWESELGRELISTFVLSQKELDFLVARDLFTSDGYNAFANRAITWATWTTFASFFTYWVHRRFTKGTFLSFAIFYTFFIVITIYASNEWHNLYRHMHSCHSDDKAAKLSLEHSEGGKEYYLKLLKRNRILRSLLRAEGDKYISAVGDERGVVTPYFMRYELLKDIGLEDDEIRPTMSGDVF